MAKLTDKQRQCIALLMRSPDEGDGWRKCSAVIWRGIVPMYPDDLVEKRPSDDGGFVRLTERGKVVADYL